MGLMDLVGGFMGGEVGQGQGQNSMLNAVIGMIQQQPGGIQEPLLGHFHGGTIQAGISIRLPTTGSRLVQRTGSSCFLT